MTAQLVFEANDLWKSYGQRAVLKGVSLGIPKGAIVGLVGDNGSGKSTLIKCALGLLRPARGQLTVLGEEAWNLSAFGEVQDWVCPPNHPPVPVVYRAPDDSLRLSVLPRLE